MRRKIAGFTNVEFEGVISGQDVKTTIYELPLLFHAQGLDTFLLKKMGIESRHADLREWTEVVRKYREPKRRVRVGVVGDVRQDLSRSPEAPQSGCAGSIRCWVFSRARLTLLVIWTTVVFPMRALSLSF